MTGIIPMKLNEFNKYISFAVKEYANEKFEAGTWGKSNALENAEQTYNRLLPNGLATTGN
ncbi:hypothetical protein [Weissella soli]|uniref:hypothetical protein n=1 Tax=Weissella soli TaxID=155866 RepID=UPI001F20360A|nr:hypothetical protein [Weissella soli]GJM47895.1 hypothetical protein WSSLDB02_04520 [Weissella soli]